MEGADAGEWKCPPMKRRCKRCGKWFFPELRSLGSGVCCDQCCVRNLFDGLGLPTPPELLDQHTKYPTLTQAEYQKKLNEQPQDEDESDN